MSKPTRAHLAKLLLAAHPEATNQALIVWGPYIATEFPQVYAELLECTWPLSLGTEHTVELDLPSSGQHLLTCSYLDFCASERKSQNWLASSVWRLLRQVPRSEYQLDSKTAAADLVQLVQKNVKMVPEYERLAVQDVFASRCPIGWQGHPDTYLRKQGLIDTVSERKAPQDRHVFFVWQFAHWYKQKTTRSWEHYYIRWSEWGKAETVDRVCNQIYNMRKRRPLVIAAGTNCWLVHTWHFEADNREANDHMFFVCDNPAQAIAVWIDIVKHQFEGRDSFDAELPQ